MSQRADGTQLEPNPYLGPRPYENTPADIARFYGRSRETRDIVSLIVAQRTLVLYGKSGTGKSSLLNAGVLPELEARGIAIFRPLARVQGLVASDQRDSRINNIYVQNVLAKWHNTDVASWEFRSLKDYVAHLPATTEPRVMIFDQFEEIFTHYPALWQDRETFFDQVDEALEAHPLLRVVFIIREEFIAELDMYSYLIAGRLKHRFRLEQLQPDQAELAVRMPVRATRRTFEESAAKHLVNELRVLRGERNIPGANTHEQYVEPVILQVVCRSFWQSMDDWEVRGHGTITTIRLTEVEQHAHIDDALILFYENCIHQAIMNIAATIDEQTLRLWFGKQLITEAGTRRPVVRDSMHTEGMPNQMVDQLANLHIIRAEERPGRPPIYEIVHDRFVAPILQSNQNWLLQEEQRKADLQRQRFRHRLTLVLVAFIAVLVFVGGLATVANLSTETRAAAEIAIAQTSAAIAEEEIATAQTSAAIAVAYGDWYATRAVGLGGIPALGVTQTPFDQFQATTVAQQLLVAQPPRSEPIDGIDMVYVPQGCFWMGSLGGNLDEQPVFEVCLDAFWIGQYEVTNAEYDALMNPEAVPANWPESDLPKRPSWSEAQVFCQARHATNGGRLPTEAEWEYAARGPNSLRFPWGNTFDPNNVVYLVNAQSEAPVRKSQGAPSRPMGASWRGAYDMSGNVGEWTLTIFDQDRFPYPNVTSDKANDPNPEKEQGEVIKRVTRGGAWSSDDSSKLTTTARLGIAQTAPVLADTGFRCVVPVATSDG